MENPLVSLIVPTRDRLQMLKDCITSIKAHTTKFPYEIVVVDANSKDGTKEWLRENGEKEDLRVHIFDEESLFTRSANQGADMARGKYIMFLNDDMYVNPGWIDPFPEEYERLRACGSIAVRICFPDGSTQTRGWRFSSPDFAGEGSGCHIDQIQPVHWASLPFIDRELFQRMGRFRSFGKGWFEDPDLGMRLMTAGYINYFVPTAGIVHLTGQNDYRKEFEADALASRERFKQTWAGVKMPY